MHSTFVSKPNSKQLNQIETAIITDNSFHGKGPLSPTWSTDTGSPNSTLKYATDQHIKSMEGIVASEETKTTNKLFTAHTMPLQGRLSLDNKNEANDSQPRASTTSRKSSTSRKVRFSCTDNGTTFDRNNTDIQIQVVPIEAVKSRREKSRVWYNICDFTSIQEQNNIVVKLMEMGYTDATFVQNTSTFLRGNKCKYPAVMTTRGLERQTTNGFAQYTKIRQRSLVAVLEQQHYERENHPIRRAQKIAAKYQSTTRNALHASIERATVDAEFALEYLRSGDGCDVDAVRRLQALEKHPTVRTSSSSGPLNLLRRRRVLSVDL